MATAMRTLMRPAQRLAPAARAALVRSQRRTLHSGGGQPAGKQEVLPAARSWQAGQRRFAGAQGSAAPGGQACRLAAVAQPDAQLAASTSGRPAGGRMRMLYDGDCPLCMREVNMLRKRDATRDRIEFVNIAADDYAAEENAGISFEQAMGTIHVILPDGRVVTNVEAFRELYEAVDLGWVYAITKVEPVGRAANWVYDIWARNRMAITGRPDLEVVLQNRADKQMCRGS